MPDLTADAIDKILKIAPAQTLSVADFTYIDKGTKAELFVPPAPSTLLVHTLSGFVKLLENNFENFMSISAGAAGSDIRDSIVHVESFACVRLYSNFSDKFGRRGNPVQAALLSPERSFAFNTFVTQESFNIALRSMFVQDGELDALVQLAGNIASNTELRQEDDGFTQNVMSKSGTWLSKEITVKPRVTLRPFRTFLEVDQPQSDFIFRVKNDEQKGNLCALFEADGGGWKLTAMDTIASWLKQQITTSPVTAINGLPIIS